MEKRLIGECATKGYKLRVFESGKRVFGEVDSPKGIYSPKIVVDDGAKSVEGFKFEVDAEPFEGRTDLSTEENIAMNEVNHNIYIEKVKKAYEAKDKFEEYVFFFNS